METPREVESHHKSESDAALWKKILIVFGAVLASTFAGTTNAFNVFSKGVALDLGLNEQQAALVAGFGLLGMYLNLPVGYALDRWGPFKTGLGCALLTVAGYIATSFVPRGPNMWLLLVLCFMCVSFGSGGVFMCTLGTMITMSPTGGGVGVSLVSAAMSLSAALTIWSTEGYNKVTECAEECWRKDFRLLAVLQGATMIPGVLLLLLFRRQEYPHLREADHTPHRRGWTLWQSFVVFKDLYFWGLLLAEFAGIGTAIFLLTQADGLWADLSKGHNLGWSSNIITAFSFTNAVGNTFFGILSDWLAKKKQILSHASFLALILLLFSGVFSVLSVLDGISSPRVLAAILLASVGLLFGCTLVIPPMLVGDRYGFENFGKVFAYLTLSSSAASLGLPPLIKVVAARMGSYLVPLIVTTLFLFASGGFLLLVHRTMTKRKTREEERLLVNQ